VFGLEEMDIDRRRIIRDLILEVLKKNVESVIDCSLIFVLFITLYSSLYFETSYLFGIFYVTTNAIHSAVDSLSFGKHHNVLKFQKEQQLLVQQQIDAIQFILNEIAKQPDAVDVTLEAVRSIVVALQELKATLYNQLDMIESKVETKTGIKLRVLTLGLIIGIYFGFKSM
jgi:hypothetical protein